MVLKKIALICASLVVLVTAWLGYSAARHFVFWSPSEEIAFESGGIELAGTLVKPADAGVFPAYVMLHGAGPDTRGGPAYRAHAKALVRRGFAVLLYDKRGAGESGGDFETASYRDLIADGEAAVRYLAARTDIDGERIGLFGASESGWFTPEIAASSPAVAFVINKVGPPMAWVDTVLWEERNDFLADGAVEADLDRLLALRRRTWSYLQAAARDPSLAEGPERQALESAIDDARARVTGGERLLADALPAYDAAAYQRFAEKSSYDPAPYLEELTVPMLYVFGEHDVNVPTEQSVAILERLRRAHGKDITVLVLPDVGHVLYTWKGILNAGYPPGYLSSVGDWAAQKAGLR